MAKVLEWTKITGKFAFGPRKWTTHYGRIQGTDVCYTVYLLGKKWHIGIKSPRGGWDMLYSGAPIFDSVRAAKVFAETQSHAEFVALAS